MLATNSAKQAKASDAGREMQGGSPPEHWHQYNSDRKATDDQMLINHGHLSFS